MNTLNGIVTVRRDSDEACRFLTISGCLSETLTFIRKCVNIYHSNSGFTVDSKYSDGKLYILIRVSFQMILCLIYLVFSRELHYSKNTLPCECNVPVHRD